MITRRGVLKLMASAWFAGLALVGYATGAEALGRPRITRLSLVPPRWTPGLKLRLVLIGDVHGCEPWMEPERIASICAEANALEGDMILLLGDYASSMKFVTGYPPHAETARALSTLAAPMGVHAILGNHDYWADPAFQAGESDRCAMHAALEAVGIPVYLNHALRLERDGHAFWLAGLGDQMAYRPNREQGRSHFAGLQNLPNTFAGIPRDEPVILMAHEPYVFEEIGDQVNLMLSGHTHGGQINFFGWTPFVANPLDRRHRYGLYHGEGCDLVVTRGLGCSALPVRLGAWPEIMVLEIG